MFEPLNDLGTYQRGDEIFSTMRTAVLKAQQRNRELGAPNVYEINGKIYYERPDGELSLTPPRGWFNDDVQTSDH